MKRSIELKIKIKSLAAEARIIRQEETRMKQQRRKLRDLVVSPERPITFDRDKEILVRSLKLTDLTLHRKTVVRDVARQTLIAYAHILGKDVTANSLKSSYRFADLSSIQKMVERYGDADSKARLKELQVAMNAAV